MTTNDSFNHFFFNLHSDTKYVLYHYEDKWQITNQIQ